MDPEQTAWLQATTGMTLERIVDRLDRADDAEWLTLMAFSSPSELEDIAVFAGFSSAADLLVFQFREGVGAVRARYHQFAAQARGTIEGFALVGAPGSTLFGVPEVLPSGWGADAHLMPGLPASMPGLPVSGSMVLPAGADLSWWAEATPIADGAAGPSQGHSGENETESANPVPAGPSRRDLASYRPVAGFADRYGIITQKGIDQINELRRKGVSLADIYKSFGMNPASLNQTISRELAKREGEKADADLEYIKAHLNDSNKKIAADRNISISWVAAKRAQLTAAAPPDGAAVRRGDHD